MDAFLQMNVTPQSIQNKLCNDKIVFHVETADTIQNDLFI